MDYSTKENKYYKLKSSDYEPSFYKGKCYPDFIVGNRAIKYPDDWKLLPEYPSTSELINAIETDDKKKLKNILSVLKKWK